MFFFAVAQIVLAFAPIVEAKQGAAQAHVEEAGTALHHAHNEADCVACVARVLLSSSDLSERAPIIFVESSIDAPASLSVVLKSAGLAYSRSRAPPVIRA